ncbi:uncharacterized protein NEMAJ01_0954 [Nematocida major]|uniref:uncharacterized protein n=1 Tax=Nematocida major TaxID=1912982 RepID=UPI0020084829|nr:uncharacterized protein NEMAJ01_0954 [Nematocida major]KAH9386058.1 hypothetical protein NEMAJ01_0954 [Nematocida major]
MDAEYLNIPVKEVQVPRTTSENKVYVAMKQMHQPLLKQIAHPIQENKQIKALSDNIFMYSMGSEIEKHLSMLQEGNCSIDTIDIRRAGENALVRARTMLEYVSGAGKCFHSREKRRAYFSMLNRFHFGKILSNIYTQRYIMRDLEVALFSLFGDDQDFANSSNPTQLFMRTALGCPKILKAIQTLKVHGGRLSCYNSENGAAVSNMHNLHLSNEDLANLRLFNLLKGISLFELHFSCMVWVEFNLPSQEAVVRSYAELFFSFINQHPSEFGGDYSELRTFHKSSRVQIWMPPEDSFSKDVFECLAISPLMTDPEFVSKLINSMHIYRSAVISSIEALHAELDPSPSAMSVASSVFQEIDPLSALYVDICTFIGVFGMLFSLCALVFAAAIVANANMHDSLPVWAHKHV